MDSPPDALETTSAAAEEVPAWLENLAEKVISTYVTAGPLAFSALAPGKWEPEDTDEEDDDTHDMWLLVTYPVPLLSSGKDEVAEETVMEAAVCVEDLLMHLDEGASVIFSEDGLSIEATSDGHPVAISILLDPPDSIDPEGLLHEDGTWTLFGPLSPGPTGPAS